MKATVIGAGAWGTTFACLLADAGTPTTIWARRPETATAINRGCNQQYLPQRQLPSIIRATTDLHDAVADAELIVVVIPAQSARQVLSLLAGSISAQTTVVSLMKGIERGTGLRMSEVISQSLQIPSDQIVVVSGPNLADEIAQKQPTATVVAGSDEQRTAQVARLCHTNYFRPYTNSDVLGVELCGAVKNVIALAVGIASGLGMGDNSKATIITRGLVEITRLGLAMGARPETFSGLAGMGDLTATCSSPLSRNQSFGRRLGQGLSVQAATEASRGVAEGAKSCQAVLDLAKHYGVEMPITAGVTAVVEGEISVAEAADALMSRPRKAEGVHAKAVTAGA